MATYYLFISNAMCLKGPVIEKAVHGMSLADAKIELENINEAAMRSYVKLFPHGFNQQTFITDHPWHWAPKLCKREWEIEDGKAEWCAPWDDCRQDIGPSEERRAERAA